MLRRSEGYTQRYSCPGFTKRHNERKAPAESGVCTTTPSHHTKSKAAGIKQGSNASPLKHRDVRQLPAAAIGDGNGGIDVDSDDVRPIDGNQFEQEPVSTTCVQQFLSFKVVRIDPERIQKRGTFLFGSKSIQRLTYKAPARPSHPLKPDACRRVVLSDPGREKPGEHPLIREIVSRIRLSDDSSIERPLDRGNTPQIPHISISLSVLFLSDYAQR